EECKKRATKLTVCTEHLENVKCYKPLNSDMRQLTRWIFHKKFILALFLITALVASTQSLFLGQKKYIAGGIEYNTYNNYTIFKRSFYHLANNEDLYFPYPLEHWDLYKYSPTFAFLFGGFALLPDMMGLPLWNILNALVIVLAVYYLPKLTNPQKALILLCCVVESMTAIQNEQSNGLVAGLLILAFGLCERKYFLLGALCIVLTVYIKIFGLIGFIWFLFYPDRWKFVLYGAMWLILLFFLPLLVIDFYQLKFLYKSWGLLLSQDHSLSQGLSVIGWLQSWFKIDPNKTVVAITGAILFLIPFLKWKLYRVYAFRLLSLASILIWIVIFNHKAESPTFIIAMAGASLWYFMQKRNWPDTVLFISALILTTLSPTDIFPFSFRREIIEPFVLKAVPCIFIWGRITYEMVTYSKMVRQENLFLPNKPLIQT
ncbi:MAG TPA: glycosyltransferase family 87 protein, partial [Saprospiraceae bacterium]|nr:glycosyltransferase family 87 protein [Saprospiraceae bacterium]